jgi:hypothetical protein
VRTRRRGKRLAKDLSVVVDGRPDELAGLGEATGGAGGNIAGVRCVATGGGTAIAPILVGGVAATCSAWASAGLEVRDGRDVVVVEVEDRPGTMAQVLHRIADAWVNLDLAYTTCSGVGLVFGSATSNRGARGSEASVAGPGCLLDGNLEV